MAKAITDEMLIRLIAEEAGLKEELPSFVFIVVGSSKGRQALFYPDKKVTGANDLYDLCHAALAVLQTSGRTLELHLASLDNFAQQLAGNINEHLPRKHGEGEQPQPGGAAAQEENQPQSQSLAPPG